MISNVSFSKIVTFMW